MELPVCQRAPESAADDGPQPPAAGRPGWAGGGV